MKYNQTSVGTEIEILANTHFVCKSMTLDFSNVADTENGEKVVKAGSPITAAGVVDNTGTADVVGILWKNCYEGNPNCAVIIHGFIDQTKANAASGLTLAVSTWGSDVPMITWLNAPEG